VNQRPSKSVDPLQSTVNRAFKLATADGQTFQGLPVAVLKVFVTVAALFYVFIALPVKTVYRIVRRVR
jgi:hypothetical protein